MRVREGAHLMNSNEDPSIEAGFYLFYSHDVTQPLLDMLL
jgi:hypothetical protein